MLKKVSKLMVLTCVLAFTGSAFAQNEVAEFPQYGFWSNWGIGITGSLNWQPRTQLANYYGDNSGWGHGITAGLGIQAQKEIDRGVGFRVRFNHPSIFVDSDIKVNTANQFTTMNSHYSLSVEMMLSINNSFHNWDPNRKGSLYLFAGAGPAFSGNNYYRNSWGSAMLDAGIGYSYKLSERSTIFAEGEMDIVSDIPAFWAKTTKADGTKKAVGFHHTNFLLNVGYLFNLGLTSADQELMAQRALVTKEAMEALTAENEEVKQELAEAKVQEQKLKEEVKKLNAETIVVQQTVVDNARNVSDSLRAVIDQLKADQLNYYAIPFSVLYANDDWHVSEAEMIKVKAIARVMKDNPGLKLTVVGFCDYTGSDSYNMKLSQKRAEEVKRLLVKKYGIDGDRLTVDYKGKTVAFGDIQYSLNRRVSFYRVIE